MTPAPSVCSSLPPSLLSPASCSSPRACSLSGEVSGDSGSNTSDAVAEVGAFIRRAERWADVEDSADDGDDVDDDGDDLIVLKPNRDDEYFCAPSVRGKCAKPKCKKGGAVGERPAPLQDNLSFRDWVAGEFRVTAGVAAAAPRGVRPRRAPRQAALPRRARLPQINLGDAKVRKVPRR